jgi:hypothetical protein
MKGFRESKEWETGHWSDNKKILYLWHKGTQYQLKDETLSGKSRISVYVETGTTAPPVVFVLSYDTRFSSRRSFGPVEHAGSVLLSAYRTTDRDRVVSSFASIRVDGEDIYWLLGDGWGTKLWNQGPVYLLNELGNTVLDLKGRHRFDRRR